MRSKVLTIIAVVSLVIMASYFGYKGYQDISKPPMIYDHYGTQVIDGVAQFQLWGSMAGYTAPGFYYRLNTLKACGVSEIKIFIMSGGGLIVDSFATVDILMEAKRMGFHITTVAYGMVASAAIPVFLCGDHRISGPNTVFMLHKPDREYVTDENTIEIMDLDEMLYITFVAAHCDLTYDKVDELCTEFTWFTAEEAKRYGMVDEIQ